MFVLQVDALLIEQLASSICDERFIPHVVIYDI